MTPGHFLIGRPLIALPESNLTSLPENRLCHYRRLQQIIQQFWQRWSIEYLGELQTRQKWKQEASRLLKVGSLVLVKEDNLPPLRWKTARVVAVHPGADQVASGERKIRGQQSVEALSAKVVRAAD